MSDIKLREVNFYLFKSPYVTLILSNNHDNAISVYENEICKIEEEDSLKVEKVSKVRALRILSDSTGEDGEKTGLAESKKQLDSMCEWFQIALDKKGLTLVLDKGLLQ